MTQAIVVFSDGSKQMAHNLDDGRFRWHERKVYEAEQILFVHMNGIYIRDCSNPKTVQQAKEWRALMHLQLGVVRSQIEILKAHYVSHRTFMDNSQHLRIAEFELCAQISALKQVEKVLNLRSPDNELDAVFERLKRIQDENKRLRAVLKNQFGLSDVEIDKLGRAS